MTQMQIRNMPRMTRAHFSVTLNPPADDNVLVRADSAITLFTRSLHVEIVDAFFDIRVIACKKAPLWQKP